nr:hypothetical protein [Candidatus Gracilibacteria bacterium]
MRDKIISFFLGVLVGGIIVYGYTYYTTSKTKTSSGYTASGQTRGNFDPANMTDSQLENLANRAGITKEELKKRLDAGENIRDIIPMGGTRGGSGSTRTFNNQNQGTGTQN